MNTVASPLTAPAWLPWVLILVLLLAVFAVIGILIARRLKKQSAPPTGLAITPAGAAGEAADAPPPPERVHWWTPQNRRRPCFLMTGEDGAGVTTLINGLTNRTYAGTAQAEWRMAGDVLMYDVPGSVLKNAASWDKAVRGLGWRRPRRPLDGIVLAVSVQSLMADPNGERPGAQLIRAGLDQLRRELGFELPAYVVVTQCDRLEGFGALVQLLGHERCQEMLGWSSDRRLETSFTRTWVDDAFAKAGTDLGASQLALIGAGGAAGPRRAALAFPGQVASLRPALGAWLDPIFSSVSGTEAHLLRGIYFCGAPAPDSASTARVFSRDLFHQKIFREGRLARAAGFGTGSRRHWATAAQAAAICLALIFTAGLWSAERRLAPIRDTRLEPLLDDLTHAVSGGREAERARNPLRAVNYLGTIESLDSGGFGSWFLPASWGDPVGHRIERLLVPAFQEMVVETCRLALEYRLSSLTQHDRPRGTERNGEAARVTAVPEKFEDYSGYVLLRDYLRQAGALETNLVRYTRLGESEATAPAELQALLEYLTGEATSVGLRLAESRRLRRVLNEARWPAVRGREAFLDRAAERSRRLGEEFLVSWIGKSPLPAAIGDLARSIDKFEQGASNDAASLENLQVKISEVSAALDGGGWDWINAEFDRARWGVLGKTLEEAPFANDSLIAALDAEGERQQDLLFEAVQKASAGMNGPVVDAGEEKIRVAGSIRALSSAIARLGSIAPTSTGVALPAVTPNTTGFLWDLAELREAAGVAGAYADYQRSVLPTLPERFRVPLRRLAAARVRAAAVAQVAGARATNPAAYRDGADPERTLLPEIRNFSQAADLFADLSKGLENLGAPSERDSLRQLLAAQGTGLLSALDRELDRRRPYSSRAQGWDESVPLPFAMFDAGSKAELRRYLDAERTRVANLAGNYAKPVLTALDKIGADASREHSSRWRQINDALTSFADARPGNHVRSLERYVEEAADQLRPETGCVPASPDAGSNAGATPALGAALGSGDLFANAERSLRTRAVDLCRAALATRYRQLADFFNSRLAGQYPFTGNPRPQDGPGADPADAGKFFQMLDQVGAGLEAALAPETRNSESARQALGFLRRMTALRPFFTIPEGDTGPSVSFSAEFRANRARETGGNRIIDWALRVGDQPVLSESKTPAAVRWRHGDPAQLELRYAKDSLAVPAAQGLAEGAKVDGRSVRFDFVSPWSLIQALREHRTEATETTGPAAADGLLRLRIPNQSLKGEALAPSVVFVRLKPEAGKGGVSFPSAETAFPDRAPGLAADLSWGHVR